MVVELEPRHSKLARWTLVGKGVLGSALFAALSVASASASDRPAALEAARDLHRAGKLDEALEAYLTFARVEETSNPGAAATALNNACLISSDRAAYPAAEHQCRLAIDLRRRAGDRAGLARTLNNLGRVLEQTGRYDEAEHAYREALGINRERGDLQSQLLNHSNLGALAASAGRYGAALAHQETVVEIASQHLGEPWAAEELGIARINQGVVFERIGAYEEALDAYRSVRIEDLDEAIQASLRLNLGVVYRNLGDSVSALREIEGAASQYDAMGALERLGRARLDQAIVLDLNMGAAVRAETLYLQALDLARRTSNRPLEAEVLLYLGKLMLSVGRLEEAESHFRSGLAAAREMGSQEGTWSSLEGLGRVTEATGDLEGALEHYEAALAEIERGRADLADRRLRSSFSRERRSAYVATVEALATLQEGRADARYSEKALEVVQRAKSRALLDALGDDEQVAKPLRVGELIGSKLPIVEFFMGDRFVYRWVIDRGKIEMARLGERARIRQWVVELHGLLARGSTLPAGLVDELSMALLGGLNGSFAGRGELQVGLDAELGYLPFEILRLPGAEEPLVESLALSYVPSASWASVGTRTMPEGAVSFAGIALAESALVGSSDRLRGLLVSRFGLRPLRRVEEELAIASSLLAGDHWIRIGPTATEASFFEIARQGARVLHVGSHTVIDEGSRYGTAVLLAPDGDDDGILTPREIAASRMEVGLTVLAACRTALVTGAEGEGLSTLTGSVLTAGSAATLATLWEVGDQATMVFMEQFYYHLGRGVPAARALQAAKRQMRHSSEWAAPHLWAGYVLVGTGEDLGFSDRGGNHLRWAAGLATVLGVLAAGAAWRRSATRR